MAKDKDLINQDPADTRVKTSWFRSGIRSIKDKPGSHYAVSILTVGLATGFRLFLHPLLGEHHPFTIYFAAVAITAWYGGFWPAVTALGLSYLAADWFFVTPRFAFNWPHANLDEFIALIAFLFSGLAIALTSKVMRDALERAREEKRKLQIEIQERERAEQQLQQAQVQLRQHAVLLEQRVEERTAHLRETIRSLEGVCYHIAHDLRAPLRAISRYVAVLKSELPNDGDENKQDYLQRISEAALRMDMLIKGLLQFGQLGHGEFALEAINPNSVVERVLEQYEGEIRSQGASISIRGLWPTVLGNEKLFEAVIDSFLSNALKFVSPDRKAAVELWSEELEGSTRFYVEDNGIGIPEQYMGRAFGIFERLHPHEPYPGIGIGLAIAKKAAERMGGNLGVESKVHQGSRFWLDLPSILTTVKPQTSPVVQRALQTVGSV